MTIIVGAASTLLLLLVGSNSWSAKRWIELKDAKISLLEEKLASMKERLSFLEMFKATVEDRLKDGNISFKDARDRIDHIEQGKASRLELNALACKYDDELKVFRDFLSKFDVRLNTTQERLEASIARFESKLDSLQELMSKIVIIGSSQK